MPWRASRHGCSGANMKDNGLGWLGWIPKAIAFVVGAFLSLPPLTQALMVLMGLDIVAGVAVAVTERALTSCRMFVGLTRKVLILLIVAVAHVVEVKLGLAVSIGSGVALFYCAHEALSILENGHKLGVPLPEKLVRILTDAADKESKSHPDDAVPTEPA